MEKYLKSITTFIENHDLSIHESDFINLQYEIVEKMEIDKIGFEITQDVLKLMENYPLIEFGTPGPLTHFIESFYKENQNQYEKILNKSVSEKPTIHTVWLLNRIINTIEKPEKLINLMKSINENKNLDIEIRNLAGNFLE